MKTLRTTLLLGIGLLAVSAVCPQQLAAQTSAAQDPVIENIMTRTSVRNYKSQPVGRDTLQIIVDAGLQAPSAMNKQDWEVRVVGRKTLDELAALLPQSQGNMRMNHNMGGMHHDMGHMNHADSTGHMSHNMGGMNHGGMMGNRPAGVFYNAPAAFFIAAEKYTGTDGIDWPSIDAALLSENIMLAANALGLGTVYLGGPIPSIAASADAQAYLKKFGFSDNYVLQCVILVGYPEEVPAPKDRDASKAQFVE